jgi:hypothetical protein
VFTSRILPYKYITNVDGKIKWNVWSFDEGLSSRVPYESAARTLQQSKRSYAGYTIRQGMAIVLEHNFMMTDAGRENFKNQLNQLIGSIQLTNDMDVHVALVLAPSYQKTMKEKYLTNDKSSTQICREFVDMFGFVQKNQNALDILIEEAKAQLKTWGALMPDFMLCNSKLTFQLTMTPDATNYVTQGPEGAKRLKSGPDMQSYRGIGIVHTRAFSMETGAPPRDMLRRRVRVAEYARIMPHKDNHKRLFQLYNEERDTWSTFTFQDLLQKALCGKGDAVARTDLPGSANNDTLLGITHAMVNPGGMASFNAQSQGRPQGAMLGRHLQVGGQDSAMESQLVEFYKQVFSRSIKTEFFFHTTFLDKKVVYVPGAVDFSKQDIYDDVTDAASKASYPPFISNAIDAVQQAIARTGGAGWGQEEKNRARFQIQSVALYPRQAQTFATDIAQAPTGGGTFSAANTANQAAAAALLGGGVPALDATIPLYQLFNWPQGYIFPQNQYSAGYTPEHGYVKAAMAVRNFNRYGIPTQVLQGNLGEHAKIDEVINTQIDLADPTFNHLDQTLRDRGAFFCPNHFKGPQPRLSDIGDVLGYNMIMTQDFASELTKLMNGGRADASWSSSTFLYDIVLNPSNHSALLRAVTTVLRNMQVQMIAAEDGGNIMDRLSLTETLTPLISTALTTYNAGSGARYDQPSKVETQNAFYWLLPRTENASQEIMCDANTTPHARSMRARGEFNANPTITLTLIGAIEPAASGFPRGNGFEFTKEVPLQGAPRLSAPTEVSARNFFHMLAWRMWADQEIPLHSVYNATGGAWPPVRTYLFPGRDYGYGHFGNGVMNFTEQQADWAGRAAGVSLAESQLSRATEHIEVVILRPNIEHHMLGIILGQGGESLGSTFWGQTELSCYDDSMHGIWGMSYKYNERAIVINERNLVRLWDIAYDGYVGGKEDSAVDWNSREERNPNSLVNFVKSSMDVTVPYRGPSMMVMAFNHSEALQQGGAGPFGENIFKEKFKSNWPSPIVFYDQMDKSDGAQLSADFDNIHVVEAEQFRVFNSDLYRNAYMPYQKKMPNFYDLHMIRKNAGLAASENEASSDALAFQGTMRTLSADNGAVIQEVMGSGHHGPDFVGCASLRAGKGYKINSQPTVQRLV